MLETSAPKKRLKKGPFFLLFLLGFALFFWAKLTVLYIHPLKIQNTQLLPNHKLLVVWKPKLFGSVFYNVSQELGDSAQQLMKYTAERLFQEVFSLPQNAKQQDMQKMEEKWYLHPDYWYYHKNMLFGIIF